jgi:hopanoid biosynthesis associated RND transporter like protein HpnN
MLVRVILHLVDFSRRRAGLVIVAGLALAVLATIAAATWLGVDTDTNRLISPDLPWRQREAAFDKAFPQFVDLTAVVIDGATPEIAETAADRLAERLSRDVPRLYHSVRRPDGGPFFRRNGLLFLEPDELAEIAEQTIQAQGFIAALAADPTLRGLFGVLDQAVLGIAHGAADAQHMEAPFAALAEAVETGRPLSWSSLFTGRKPGMRELRRFVLVQPVLDHSALAPGERATTAIRAAVAELGIAGVRVRLTGPVPLADEEFQSVVSGTGGATVASVVLVGLLLFWALRQVRLVVSILATLTVGLLTTAGFAALAVGTLNMVSVAFAVMFVGIAVDFGIQFAVRYRHERFLDDDPARALWATGTGIGVPLGVAALAAAAGFLAFVPTPYSGVSELGLIAGVGMIIALGLNLSLLPALLTALRPAGVPRAVGWQRAAPLDDWLLSNRVGVCAITALFALAAIALVTRLEFDFNPLNLKDPRTESVATVYELMDDPATTPQSITVVRPAMAEVTALADRLAKLPEVDHVLSLTSFVPERQQEKLAIIADLKEVIGPSLELPKVSSPVAAEAEVDAAKSIAEKLKPVESAGAKRLATVLAGLTADRLPAARAAILGGLAAQIDGLRDALQAAPVTLDNLPESLRRDWVAADGQARLEVHPKASGRDNEAMRRFVAAVRTLAPDAGGAPVAIQESADTIVSAFRTAGISALFAIALILGLVLRRVRDVLLVLAPLVLAGLFTLATATLVGLSLDFANVIALPILLGIGVVFDIYFVMNWRRGMRGPLQSSTARAIVFSAFTTGTAFGSLALSAHPGTADMGKLLSLSLAWTLVCTLLVLPALLGPPPADR